MSEAIVTPENTEVDAATAEANAKLTQAEMELQKAKEIVEPMARENVSHDEMAIKLVQSGFSYKKAGKLLVKALEDLGVLLSRKDRFNQVSDILLENEFAPKTWDEVQSVVEFLAQELDATDEKQALTAVLKFAKQQKIDLPPKPRGQVGRNPNSIRVKQLNWSLDNPTASDADFTEWFNTTGEERLRYYLRIHSHIRSAYENGFAAGQNAA